MLKILNDYFKGIEKEEFLKKAAFITFISDVANIWYINSYFLPKYVSRRAIANTMAIQGVDINMLSPEQFESIQNIFLMTLSAVFYAFLVYNFVAYICMAKDKNWAKKYVFGYALTGAFLTVFELPELFRSNLKWAIIMLATTLVYIYASSGLHYFKKMEKERAAKRALKRKS